MKEKTAEEKNIEFFQGIGTSIISWGIYFYLTLLNTVVWNWFLAEKLFIVGYWEMFLGVLVTRFIFNVSSGATTNIRLNEEFGKQKASKRVFNMSAVAFGHTIGFAILFIVHMIISYYS